MTKPITPAALLKVGLKPVPEASPQSVDPPEGPSGPESTDRLLPLRILAAEDLPENQLLMVSFLEQQGHSVVAAANGKEAVQLFKTEPFDLVLMDLQMPEMGGLEATAEIRMIERSKGTHTPVIGVTAHAMKGDRERCLRAGMDEYISKPIRREELFKAMQRCSYTSSAQ